MADPSIFLPGRFLTFPENDTILFFWQQKKEPSRRFLLVEHRGVEPLTSTMRMSRATNCANAPNIVDEFFADSPLTARFFPFGLKPSGRTTDWLVLPTVLMPQILPMNFLQIHH